VSALADLFTDAAAAVWQLAGAFVHGLVRDKGYAVAASSGAEHELDYYTGPGWTTQELFEAMAAARDERVWERWWNRDR
jgi:hypothetical protein